MLEHPALTSFCEIPLASLRENSVEELDLGDMGAGVPGAIVLSSLLPSASALRSLKCAPPCTQSQAGQRPLSCALCFRLLPTASFRMKPLLMSVALESDER